MFEHRVGVLALDLASGRGVAFLRIELFRNKSKMLDLLGPSEMTVGGMDFLFEELRHRRMRYEGAEASVLHVVGAGPLRERVKIDFQQRSQILFSISENDCFADVWTGLQRALHFRRRDVLGAAGDEKVLLAVNDTIAASGRELGDVAGHHPSFVIERCSGGSVILPVASKDSTAARDNFAAGAALDVSGERLYQRSVRLRPHVSRTAQHPGFGASVDVTKRNPPGLPSLDHALGYRRAAGCCTHNMGKTQFIESRPDHQAIRGEPQGLKATRGVRVCTRTQPCGTPSTHPLRSREQVAPEATRV